MRFGQNSYLQVSCYEDAGREEPVLFEASRKSTGNRLLSIVHSTLLVLNVALMLVMVNSILNAYHSNDSVSFVETFSPAGSAIEYVVERIDLHREKSDFLGEPRPELDEAWSSLLQGAMLRITEDEMRVMNKTSVALEDGSGYIGYLEVFHMLHCVKRMYQFRHSENYPELARDGQLSNAHWEHCFETLRRGIMCNADVTVNTYSWDPSNPKKLEGHTFHPRMCTDWGRLQEWVGERAIEPHVEDLMPMDKLVPDGEDGSIGPVYEQPKLRGRSHSS